MISRNRVAAAPKKCRGLRGDDERNQNCCFFTERAHRRRVPHFAMTDRAPSFPGVRRSAQLSAANPPRPIMKQPTGSTIRDNRDRGQRSPVAGRAAELGESCCSHHHGQVVLPLQTFFPNSRPSDRRYAELLRVPAADLSRCRAARPGHTWLRVPLLHRIRRSPPGNPRAPPTCRAPADAHRRPELPGWRRRVR